MQASIFRALIFRHAHAAKATAGEDDFDRKLDERGRREAAETGASALRLDLVPELILCSPAQRTRETLRKAGRPFNEVTTRLQTELYPGTSTIYLTALKASGPIRSAMLIGHNPGISELARDLAGDGDHDAMRQLSDCFPTAGLAIIEFTMPFSEIEAGHGYLRQFLVPER